MMNRFELWKRDGGICSICAESVPRKQASRDHILPVSMGGLDFDWNLQLTHHVCNQERGNDLEPTTKGFDLMREHAPYMSMGHYVEVRYETQGPHIRLEFHDVCSKYDINHGLCSNIGALLTNRADMYMAGSYNQSLDLLTMVMDELQEAGKIKTTKALKQIGRGTYCASLRNFVIFMVSAMRDRLDVDGLLNYLRKHTIKQFEEELGVPVYFVKPYRQLNIPHSPRV